MIYFLIAAMAAGLLLYALVMSAPGKRGRRKRIYRGAPSSRGSYGVIDPREVATRWGTIVATSKTGASGMKSSINEADKLFDYVLKHNGLPGDTMGERLKAAKPRFKNNYQAYDAVWRAHKLRNALVHDVEFDLVISQASEALRDFESGLKELGAL